VNTRPTSPAASDRLPWSWVGEPRGALTLIVAWASFHTLLRLALSSALTADDAREAVLAQSLQWGYQARQPPLYNWLVWAAFRLLGPGILALTLVKYAALALAFWFVYLTGRRILADPRLATLGAFALLLLAPLSWNVHEALTHSVTVLAACAATVYTLVRLGDAPSRRTYAGLGLAVGFGLLSKFTFVVFLVAVGLAALTVDRYRRRVLQPAILISALVATVLVLPYAVWFVGAGHDLGRLYAREVHIEDGDAWAGEASTGLAYVLRIAALYLVPVGIALGLCFPGIHRRPPPDSPDSPGGRLLGWLLVWMFVILAGTALAGGLGFLKARWLIPAFFLAPLYGLSRLERHGVPEARLAAFAGILILVEMVIAGGLTARVVGANLFRQPFRMNEPVDAIATGLRRAGFTRGTIVAGFGTLAGNLAVRFPDSRTLHTEYPDFQPPTLDSGQCLVVWDRHPQQQGNADASATPEDVERLAGSLGITLTGSERRGVVEAPFLHDTRRIRRVYYFLFPEGIGRCR
jgi:4-amino-4-deoxy-L-arabinose transferase-like glycosyltransferase